ncbi:MAG TPA: hypothetical protein VF412_08225 [Bdellovibrio sp.]|uniref:hypothetical protein n=1 Tax=Bdellovibrio sp. TaxID=28201 RepID=UPI002F1873E8
MRTIVLLFMLFLSLAARATPAKDAESLEHIKNNFQWMNEKNSKAFRIQTAENSSSNLRVKVVDPDGNFRVFGYTEKQIVAMSGDEHGGACTHEHDHDDIANRWCHASIVKLADAALRSLGVNPLVAASAAASIFVYKEYGYDLHPSKADLVVVADQSVYSSDDLDISFTMFGDGSPFIILHKKF